MIYFVIALTSILLSIFSFKISEMNVIYIEHDEHDACSMIIYQYLYSTYIEQIKFYINKNKNFI